MCQGLRRSDAVSCGNSKKSASLLLSHVLHVTNKQSHNILRTLFYRNLIKMTSWEEREEQSKMNLQFPEENALTLVGFLGGSCFFMHPDTSFDVQCIQQLCFPGHSYWQLPSRAHIEFSAWKVRGGKKGNKRREERNIEWKPARQTTHLNMKLRHAWGLQADKKPEECSSVE